MKRLVVLTGSGISAESGIPTFRGKGGLWRGIDVTKVASPEAWNENPELVLDFYNERRKVASKANPNRGHQILADLEAYFDVHIITQNVDNLHERAGSTRVLHLHGSLFEARSTDGSPKIYPISNQLLNIGDICDNGCQLRPNVVWFGEPVPAFEEAIPVVAKADLFLIVGTSLQVYPAAGLSHFLADGVPRWIVDPDLTFLREADFKHIRDIASKGLEHLEGILLAYR